MYSLNECQNFIKYVFLVRLHNHILFYPKVTVHEPLPLRSIIHIEYTIPLPKRAEQMVNNCPLGLFMTDRSKQENQKVQPVCLVEQKISEVTSQRAAKRNRLLLLCMITVGTGLKGVFVCPGGKLEWHCLAAQGGMCSGVTGSWVVQEAARFAAISFFPPSFQHQLGHAALEATSVSGNGLKVSKLKSLYIQCMCIFLNKH